MVVMRSVLGTSFLVALALAFQASVTTHAQPDATKASTQSTPHLEVRTYPSDRVVAPGMRFSLVAEVTPKPGMRVYAPGQPGYVPIALALEPPPFVELHDLRWPTPVPYLFKPTNERALVYHNPFQLVQHLAIISTPEARAAAQAPEAKVTITGTLRYQACDEQVCYKPADLDVAWTVRLRSSTKAPTPRSR